MSHANYWDKLSATDEGASQYMATYGEGPGCPTRFTLGEFINDGESVLDVGCGPGWNYDHFAEHGPEVKYKGLDYSERFVRVANKRNPGIYQVGDVRKIDEPDESWDVVILQDVLEHTNGYEKPVKRALKVAKKRVIITFWRLNESAEEDQINDDGDDGWGAAYSQKKWEKFLDSLDQPWLEHDIQFPKGHKRHFYIIDKEEPR